MFLMLLLMGIRTTAQATPEELGLAIYESFKSDSISNILRYLPTRNEMTTLALQIGMDTASTEFKQAREQYPEHIKTFREVLELVRNDERFSWKSAGKVQVIAAIDSVRLDHLPKIAPVQLTAIIYVRFTANDKKFCLVMNDGFRIGDIWKIGDQLYVREDE